MDKKYRLQIDFSEKAYKELESIQERLDAGSKSEVMRNALGVLRWIIDESDRGNRILVEKSDGPREIMFHFLERARKVSSDDRSVG